MLYLDSCAIVKLVHVEAESGALRAWLAKRGRQRLITSALARTECARALRAVDPAALSNLPAVLAQVNFLALSDVVVDQAAAFPQEKLRSLDALHLASALRLGTALTALVTYDRRLAIAAAELDLTVAQPT